jgi:glucose/mannose-6-phosphate isomerase
MGKTELDAPESFESADPGGMLALVEAFGEQCREAVELGLAAPLPGRRDFRNILTVGMGGSAIGGDLLRCCFAPGLRQPWFVNRDYSVPAWVDQDTLLLASSYSGNTEETLEAVEQGISSRATVVCLTSGGRLAEIAQERDLPLIQVPGGLPPRAALGYSFFPVAVVLDRLGLVNAPEEDLAEALDLIDASASRWGRENATPKNSAKSLAVMLEDRLPVIYSGAGLLAAVGVRWRNQFSENSKILSYSNVFPELNHNEIVGWEGAGEQGRRIHLILLRDAEDSPRVQHRMRVTTDIMGDRAAGLSQVWTEGKGRIARMFSLVCLGDFTSVYLALLTGRDPTPVESIDRLKAALAQLSG